VTLSEAKLRELVERACGGDERAASALLSGIRERVLRWALVVAGDVDDAEDITQNVALSVHRHLRDYNVQARFTTWLYALVRNAAIDMKRKSGGRTYVALDDDVANKLTSRSEDHVQRLSDQRTAQVVRAFFEQLPSRQRQLIELVDQQGHTPAEAAQVMGVEPETARVHLLRARRTLRAKMLEHHPGLFDER
jgi:RNA polymerase sigma-70 factor (ECF subfamily)